MLSTTTATYLLQQAGMFLLISSSVVSQTIQNSEVPNWIVVFLSNQTDSELIPVLGKRNRTESQKSTLQTPTARLLPAPWTITPLYLLSASLDTSTQKQRHCLRQMWSIDWHQQTFCDTPSCLGDGFSNLLLQLRQAPASLHGDRQTTAVTDESFHVTRKQCTEQMLWSQLVR